MTQTEFLAEFDETFFPCEFGPWLTLDVHDPPWTFAQLGKMQQAGLIEVEFTAEPVRYRLTMKAAKLRDKMA